MNSSPQVPISLPIVSAPSDEAQSISDIQADSSATPPVQSQTVEDFDPMVILQVGERRFNTTRSTLAAGSTYFKSLFSGNFADARSEDGSYFIDADPDAFPTILRYLRHNVLPTFFDRN